MVLGSGNSDARATRIKRLKPAGGVVVGIVAKERACADRGVIGAGGIVTQRVYSNGRIVAGGVVKKGFLPNGGITGTVVAFECKSTNSRVAIAACVIKKRTDAHSCVVITGDVVKQRRVADRGVT